MELDEIYQPIKEDLDRVEDVLAACLITKDDRINQISRHLVSVSGKRLRPALVFLSSRIGNKREESIIYLAAAIELIHTASLVHDDVIDRADLRRKHATANSRWGNEISVLLGDYVYSKAFSLLARIGNSEVLFSLSQATSTMCEGEMLQIAQKYNFDLTEEEYLRIIEKKTAALFAASCRLGAMLGGTEPAKVKALSCYGTELGIAFQIVDDCLDIAGEEQALGKSLGSDLKGGKLTLPLIFLLNAIPEQKKEEVKSLLGQEDKQAPRAQIKEMLQQYQAIAYGFNRAREHADKAKGALETLGESAFKSHFLDLVDDLINKNIPSESAE